MKVKRNKYITKALDFMGFTIDDDIKTVNDIDFNIKEAKEGLLKSEIMIEEAKELNELFQQNFDFFTNLKN
jgi:hypothetical protein